MFVTEILEDLSRADAFETLALGAAATDAPHYSQALFVDQNTTHLASATGDLVSTETYHEALRKERKRKQLIERSIRMFAGVHTIPADFEDTSSSSDEEGEEIIIQSIPSIRTPSPFIRLSEMELDVFTGDFPKEDEIREMPEMSLSVSRKIALMDSTDSTDQESCASTQSSSDSSTFTRVKDYKVKINVAGDPRVAYYSGSMFREKPWGLGVLKFENGDYYMGELKAGRMHGTGTFVFANDGTSLQGQFHRNGFEL